MKRSQEVIKFKSRPVRLATVLALVWVASFASEAESATIESFLDVAMHELGFDPAQKDSLKAGKVISVGLPGFERQTNELAVGAAMMLAR